MSDEDIVKILHKIERTTLPPSVWMRHIPRAASEIEQNRIDLEEYRRDVEVLTEERDRLKAALVHTATSLASAISLLEAGGKTAKKVAPSDKMFEQMLADYRRALDGAREALGGDAS